MQHESLLCDDFAAFGQYNVVSSYFIHREFLQDLQHVVTYRNGIFCEYTFQIFAIVLVGIFLEYYIACVRQRAISKNMNRFNLSIDCVHQISPCRASSEKGLTKQARKITCNFHPSLCQDVSFRHKTSVLSIAIWRVLKILCFM